MVDVVRQHYQIAHIADVTPISFRFYEYSYQTLIGDFKWALKVGHGKIEIYDCEGVCINIVEF